MNDLEEELRSDNPKGRLWEACAARRVVPPDLIAPAARSPILRKLINPLDMPPPESGSSEPLKAEKFEPVPDPYLKSRASRVQRSMMPPSLTRSSLTDWMKHACGCGWVYASSARVTVPVSGSEMKCPCEGPEIPYAQFNPVLNHCGLFGALT